jgi:hypothetical protein
LAGQNKGPRLLTDTELRKDDIEKIFDIDRAGDTAEPVSRQAKIVGAKFQLTSIPGHRGSQMVCRLTQEVYMPQAGGQDIAGCANRFGGFSSEQVEELFHALAGHRGNR